MIMDWWQKHDDDHKNGGALASKRCWSDRRTMPHDRLLCRSHKESHFQRWQRWFKGTRKKESGNDEVGKTIRNKDCRQSGEKTRNHLGGERSAGTCNWWLEKAWTDGVDRTCARVLPSKPPNHGGSLFGEGRRDRASYLEPAPQLFWRGKGFLFECIKKEVCVHTQQKYLFYLRFLWAWKVLTFLPKVSKFRLEDGSQMKIMHLCDFIQMKCTTFDCQIAD